MVTSINKNVPKYDGVYGAFFDFVVICNLNKRKRERNMIIIKEDKYIGPSTLIDSKQMALFNKNIAIIQQEVYEYLQGYINHINGTQVMHPSQFKRKYQYSTLKYFHLELGI